MNMCFTVKGGNWKEPDGSDIYSRVISNEVVRMGLFLAQLNGLDVMVGNIGWKCLCDGRQHWKCLPTQFHARQNLYGGWTRIWRTPGEEDIQYGLCTSAVAPFIR